MPRPELAFIVAEGGVERVGTAFIYLRPLVTFAGLDPRRLALQRHSRFSNCGRKVDRESHRKIQRVGST